MQASPLTAAQQGLLVRYRDLLLDRNARTNLTAIRDPQGVDQRLIAESLRLLPAVDTASGPGVDAIDIGTGGGIPGIPLAIARPDVQWTLVDATAKKIAFLQDVISELSIPNVVLYHGRIEELAHESHMRGRYQILTARAVSSLSALLELGLPMVRTGGTLLLPKGPDIAGELEVAMSAARILGGRIVSHGTLPDAGTGVETRLVVVRKERETPAAYPRRTGLPARSPLGKEPSNRATH